MYRDNHGYYGVNLDKVNIYLNSNKSITGVTPIYTIHRNRTLTPVENAEGWYQYAVNLPTASMEYAYIIFEGVSDGGNVIYMDDIVIDQKEDCPAPVNFHVTYNSDCDAVLTWNVPAPLSGAPSPIEGYNIYRDDNLIASNITANTYTDSNFDTSEGHTWSVSTVCAEGETNPVSVTKSVCSNGDECVPVIDLEVTYNSDCEAEITWNMPQRSTPTPSRGDNSVLLYSTHNRLLLKTTVEQPDGYQQPVAGTIGNYEAMALVNGEIYTSIFDGVTNAFGKIDQKNGELTFIKFNGAPDVSSMAWSAANNTLYATIWGSLTNSVFGKIDIATGNFTQLGTLPSTFFIAIDNDGVCYALSMKAIRHH